VSKQSESESKSGGIGVLGLLGVAFVVLKLTGVIDWSWWWVTAPFWGGLAILIVALIVIYIVSVLIKVIEKVQENSRRQ
jgi:phosphoglycerol transferase MdoB-like AlkP superfamily enzyme